MGLLYDFLRFVARVIINIFFSDVEVVGSRQVPRHGPVIFAGNHQNGLIDPLVLLAYCPRSTHFMAKSTLFKVCCLGSIIRATGAIPIKRRQDQPDGSGQVDNSSIFEHVFHVLASGKAFGIFPEGISHDRSELQDLKTGIARIALGVSSKNEGLDLKIVPVGLNYVQGDQFRSKLLVHFGPGISIPRDILEKHARDEREAVRSLLKIIEKGMRGVTVNAHEWETIELCHLSCDLYAPPGHKWKLDSRIKLMRQFADAYEKLQEYEHIKQLRTLIHSYWQNLKLLNLTDREVRKGERRWFRNAYEMFFNLIFLLIFVPLSIPGSLLNAPVALYAKHKAIDIGKKAGRDVVGTYKIIIIFVLLPILYIVYSVIAALLLHFYTNTFSGALWFFIFFFGLPVLSYMTVRVAEEGKHCVRRFTAIVRICSFRTQLQEMQEMRRACVAALRAAVQLHVRSFNIAPQDRIFPPGTLPESDAASPMQVLKVSEAEWRQMSGQLRASAAAAAEDERQINSEIDRMVIDTSKPLGLPGGDLQDAASPSVAGASELRLTVHDEGPGSPYSEGSTTMNVISTAHAAGGDDKALPFLDDESSARATGRRPGRRLRASSNELENDETEMDVMSEAEVDDEEPSAVSPGVVAEGEELDEDVAVSSGPSAADVQPQTAASRTLSADTDAASVNSETLLVRASANYGSTSMSGEGEHAEKRSGRGDGPE